MLFLILKIFALPGKNNKKLFLEYTWYQFVPKETKNQNNY